MRRLILSLSRFRRIVQSDGGKLPGPARPRGTSYLRHRGFAQTPFRASTHGIGRPLQSGLSSGAIVAGVTAFFGTIFTANITANRAQAWYENRSSEPIDGSEALMSCTRYVELDPGDERVSKGTMSANEVNDLDPETAIVLVYTGPWGVVMDRRTAREVKEGLIISSRSMNGKWVIAVGGGSEGPKEYVELEALRKGSVTVLKGAEASRFISKRP